MLLSMVACGGSSEVKQREAAPMPTDKKDMQKAPNPGRLPKPD